MHKNALGIKKQYFHTQFQQEVLDWLHTQYRPSSFGGRFQIGYRKIGERGIYPLFTGELGPLETFLESMHVSNSLDYYITANSVHGVSRNMEGLFSLHNLVIDIDAHSSGDFPVEDSTFEEFLWRLKRDLLSEEGFPSPTSVVWTGRGLQLWWAIVPMSAKCLPWYQEIQETLVERIQAFVEEYECFDSLSVDGAASSNPVGYFRIPGGVNTKSATITRVEIWGDSQYDTHDLIKWAKAWKQSQTLEVKRELPDEFAGKYLASDLFILKNFHTTAFFRVKQIIQLRLLRDNDIGEETRNNMCFIVYNAMLPSLGPELAWEKLMRFNSGFKEPMSEKELHQTIDTSLKKGGYRYKNATIINFLGITPEEQEAIGLYTPTRPYSPITRLAGHPARRASKRAIKDDRNARIKQLSENGYSRSKIASELGVSRNTVSNVLGVNTTRKDAALSMLDQGFSTADVAQKLGISIRSVQLYRKKANAKFA